MATLLYQQNHIEIYWDEGDKWLYANWIGYQSVEEVKKGCEQILRLLMARNADAVLNDHSNVEGIWLGAAEWLGKDWLPRMRSAGMRHFAWVYSPSRFSQLSTDTSVQAAPPGIVHLFWTMEEARRWLRTQKRRASITQRLILPPR